ncbi:aminotransferase class I/II-fold pyridoxal phosphate-dependent enzyme [Paucibacter sp. APW11]|uniref:histidinol-phosphate transaminase n=1 Tax=Roseateles aquae TaxID=3077235 RepID=A0ABU3PCX9_9BURK|nr:aminotransferase class I/II-fold pyridoxal phosphate-dependent enzyme [Paucibacter sp. APW11]MDT9000192.1 aminotransferase class I/II-fold pyridoxal phosphate-dependent enzyme [Paucibacter sp. APW11]
MSVNVHGGSDGLGPISHDFSSNAWPLPPPESLQVALVGADRQRYPDPAYAALRQSLAHHEQLAAERVLPAAGGSEAIRRLSLAAKLAGIHEVFVPSPGFGDYAAAAQALGLAVHGYADAEALCQALANSGPALVWACEPCNPTGSSFSSEDWARLQRALDDSGAILAVDLACEPLRLDGQSALPAALAEACWRLQCPNKALGLTGVRAAYLLAPHEDDALRPHAEALAASWVLSAEGVVLLEHWTRFAPALELQRQQLRRWRDSQRALLAELGWQQRPSCSNFWLARPPRPFAAAEHAALRAAGIKLRDAASFGMAGLLRVSVQPPVAQAALKNVLEQMQCLQ